MYTTAHPSSQYSPIATAPPTAHSVSPEMSAIELSVVMPCLNEAETLETCICAAQRAMTEHGIAGEIIVADNGSTDGSPDIAERLGARVVYVARKGYGSALMGGIAAARGTYILMGDADDSYDFGVIPSFVAKLREGYELVQGCRLASGGGTVEPGAMPFLHQWWGNPMFSFLVRAWFKAPIHDVHCGLRAFTKRLFEQLDQQCTGMEFASENIIKASLKRVAMAEVPITLRPDGRTAHPPHLKTFRDGWRHLRFYLMFSPRWLFLVPGALLILSGLVGYAIAMPKMRIGGVTFDVHTLLFASLAIICGYQSILFAFMTKIFAISENLLPPDRRITRLFSVLNLERGLVAGALAMVGGLVLLAMAINAWRVQHFGALDYGRTMRWVIPGVMLTAIGFQTILSSFFFSILGMRRR
jgi:glycosyltransferase involved in cell wall biosynthesis